jgi:hypothetical protein
MSDETPVEEDRALEFEERAASPGFSGPVGEFWYFLKRTRNWWMAPIIFLLLLVGGLLVLSSTALAPLIYTLF